MIKGLVPLVSYDIFSFIQIINFLLIECEEMIEHKSFTLPVQASLESTTPSFFVGGSKATFNEFPHMSAIGLKGLNNQYDWLCGGSLISEKFVLSAAHCASVGGKKPDVIRIGDRNLVSNEAGMSPQEYGIKNVVVHPQYKSNLKYHDLALFELDADVK